MPRPTDWTPEATAQRRDRYFAATLRRFVPFETPFVVQEGRMQYLFDAGGRRYIDLLAMNVCISVGHAHPDVVAAVTEQAGRLTHATTMFHHPVPAHLAEELAATLPDGFDWVVHFTSSGAEAIDLAMTMARTATGNGTFLSLRNAYHGPTAAAQSVTGIAGWRHEGMPGGVAFLPAPDGYRGIFGEGAGAAPYLDEIDRTIATATPGRVAGMIVEPIQGYGGVVEMPPGYLSGAAERVRAAGGLMIVDEVQTGFGRTGDHFWGFEADGLVPDIVVAAKGMGNGLPIGAVITRREVAEPMGERFLFHTYGANPISAAAARAVLEVIDRDGLQENARRVGAALRIRLDDLAARHDVIGDVRGRGLMLALDLVTDRASKTSDPDRAARVFDAAREAGIVLSKAGPERSILRLVPPLCLDLEDVEPVAEALDRALSAAG